MEYEYTIDGLCLLFEKMDAEPDVSLRLYWLSDYVAAAKESWQYATDAEYRALIDRQAAICASHEEKVTPLYNLELQISMVMDKVNAIQEGIKQKWTGQLLTAYGEGNRAPQLLQMLLSFMESDIRKGAFKPEEYNGLRPEDLA